MSGAVDGQVTGGGNDCITVPVIRFICSLRKGVDCSICQRENHFLCVDNAQCRTGGAGDTDAVKHQVNNAVIFGIDRNGTIRKASGQGIDSAFPDDDLLITEGNGNSIGGYWYAEIVHGEHGGR